MRSMSRRSAANTSSPAASLRHDCAEYGGQGFSAIEQHIFFEEAKRVNAPVPLVTLNAVGPTLVRFGTEQQKREFLRAVRDGDEYVINGQKMFTSGAGFADYVWLAARTDPEAHRHKGISLFIVPTSAPGFSHRPLHTMPGVSTFYTFYDDVRVPASALVGAENDRWTTTARRDGSGWRLDGVKDLVPAAQIADAIVVPAVTDDDEVGLFVVDAQDAGVDVAPVPATGGQPYADITFVGASVPGRDRLWAAGDGAQAVWDLHDRALVALCAQQIGVTGRALRMRRPTRVNANSSAGRSAQLQAIQQRMADAFIDVEAIRWTTWHAAWLIGEGRAAHREASIAKFTSVHRSRAALRPVRSELALSTNAAALLRECGQFLAPYLTAARLTGEVRRDLYVDAAAEWFARMLFSLFLTPSERLDLDDADAVTEFVREHVVRGFVEPRSGRPHARHRQVP